MAAERPDVSSHAHGTDRAQRPHVVPGSVPPPSVPLSFLAAVPFGLIACGTAFILSRSVGIHDPTSDPVVAATHFGVLSTLSMGILGAMHQFTPVITGRPLRSVRLSRATFFTWLAAAWMLPLGVTTEQLAVTAMSGALAALAIVLLIVNFASALSVRGKGTPVTGLRFALAGATATAGLGAAFVGDRQANWFHIAGHVDVAMAVIGLFGWLGVTYVAVAEKLWPMFLLAHVPGHHVSGRTAVWAVPIGATLLAMGLVLGMKDLARAGAVVLAGGLTAHLISLGSQIRHRRRKADLHLLFVVTSAIWLVVGAALSLASTLVMSHDYVFGVALAASALVAFGGWLLIALVGHAHKVVPFILWSALRGRGLQKNSAGKPLVFADLYNLRGAEATYVLTTAGVAGLCIGFAASWPIATAAGGIAFIAAGVVVAFNLTIIPMRLLSSAPGAPEKAVSSKIQG